jgi:hypothetical protein
MWSGHARQTFASFAETQRVRNRSAKNKLPRMTSSKIMYLQCLRHATLCFYFPLITSQSNALNFGGFTCFFMVEKLINPRDILFFWPLKKKKSNFANPLFCYMCDKNLAFRVSVAEDLRSRQMNCVYHVYALSK